MYYTFIFTITLLSLILYKNKLNVSKFIRLAVFINMHTVKAVRETYIEFKARSRNQTELISRSGYVAVVTGGNRGLGYEAVKKLLQCHVSVIIGCRNVADGESALKRLKTSGIEIGNSKCYPLDLASMASIKKFAETVLENHPEIHILLNNAGHALTPYELTQDGFEVLFATNYLGHCYLTHLLLPRLTATARANDRNARIVNVSSCDHKEGFIDFDDLEMKSFFNCIMAYARSKLAQVLFTKSLDAQLRDAKLPVQVHSVHPGHVYTDIFKGFYLHDAAPWLMKWVFRTPEEGARSLLHACISPCLESCGGTYISSCTTTETGGISNQKDVEKRLWKTMLDLLKLKSFGGITRQ